MTNTSPCPDCGDTFTYHGVHWAKTDCNPKLTDRQHQIITGLLMGDGWVRRLNGECASLQVAMTNKEFLEWVLEELGWVGASVNDYRSASDVARLSGGDAGDYSDQYYLQGRAFDQMDEFDDWYGGEGKSFPDDLELTPLIAKIWYCCDGGVVYSNPGRDTRSTSGSCKISASNESDRDGYLYGLFDEHGLSCRVSNGRIYFRREESEELLDWMGEPLPGFEHKWIINDSIKYYQVKS